MIFFVKVTESFPRMNLILTVVYNWNEQNCIFIHACKKYLFSISFTAPFEIAIQPSLKLIVSSQVFCRFCLHYKTYESSHYITTTTKCFCVEVFSLNRSYPQTFFFPSFQLNVNVMHSVAGALCLNTRFQSGLHALAFSGRQLFNPCARLNPWEIFEGGLLSCADSPWLINHIFLRNRWDNACENASPKICKICQIY